MKLKNRAHPPAETGTGDDLFLALQELVRAFQNRDRDRPVYFGISLAECYALDAVARRGPMSVNDLASALRLDKSRASRIARSLERRGYLRRAVASQDRRALRLATTSTGRGIENRIRGELGDRYAEAIRSFPAGIRREVPAVLRALAGAVRQPGDAASSQ